jgi:pSer/pThr/pTyr-binding forkhead associated (FHA) protein
MGEVIIIEVQNRTSSHISYFRFDREPVRIGRAFDNDVIIPDPFISPHHATIARTPDGGLSVIDSESINGVILNKGKPLSGQTPIVSGDRIVLGKTTLRILTAEHEVPPAVLLTPKQPLLKKIAVPLLAVTSFLFTLGLLVLIQFLDTSKVTKFISLLAEALPVLFIPLIWAGIWAFVGYILRRGAQFSLQYIIASSALVAITFSTEATGYIDYFTCNTQVATVLGYAAIILISAGMLFGNISVSTAIADLRRLFIAIVIVGIIATTVAIIEHSQSLENKISPKYSSTLKPPFASFIKTVSLDDYTKECETLFDNKAN